MMPRLKKASVKKRAGKAPVPLYIKFVDVKLHKTGAHLCFDPIKAQVRAICAHKHQALVYVCNYCDCVTAYPCQVPPPINIPRNIKCPGCGQQATLSYRKCTDCGQILQYY
jgi:hypothetical protein